MVSEKDYTENKDIVVAHEYAHIKHFHAIDLMICELFTALHWFNPFMWMLRRDLKLIHEYQADQAVLNKGIDAKKYQLLVLEKAVGERRFAMANHFTQKPILKRIKMMHRKNENRWKWVKLIVFIPIMLLLMQAFARPELITKSNEIVLLRFTEDKAEQWLQKWSVDNIGSGFFQPELKDIDAPRKQNNVLVILMNRKSELLVENQYAKSEDIKTIVKDFLKGRNPDGKKGPDFAETNISLLGKVKVSKGFISFRNDMETSKDEMNRVLKAIGEACLEVRNEKALQFFNHNYLDLDEEKQAAINQVVPIWFSIEKPKTIKPPPPPPPTNLKVSKEGEFFIGEYIFPETGNQKMLLAWSKKVSLDELKEYLDNEKSQIDNFNRKEGAKYDLDVRVQIEVGASDKKVNELKNILQEIRIGNVKYSSDYKVSDWEKINSSSNSAKVKNVPSPQKLNFLQN